MNIGIDIDNVITLFDQKVIKEMMREDGNLRGSGIINPQLDYLKGMFDWSKEEIDNFFNTNMERIASKLSPRRMCRFYMEQLISDGHKLYLISHRAYPHYKQPEKTTKDWLKQHHIPYTKLVLSKEPDKTPECQQYKIDLMIDDRVKQCKKMMDNGIHCLVMMTKQNKKKIGDMPYVRSWQHLYQTIANHKKCS